MLNYYKIFKNNGEYEMEIVKSINYSNENKISIIGLSCRGTYSNTYQNVVTCFESVNYNNANNKLTAFSFSPEQDFILRFMKVGDNNIENKEADYIKSVLNEDKTKALICYTIQNPDQLKCLYYDVVKNNFNDLSLFAEFCNTKYFYGNDLLCQANCRRPQTVYAKMKVPAMG